MRQQKEDLKTKSSTITQQNDEIKKLHAQILVLEGKLGSALQDHSNSNTVHEAKLEAEREAVAAAGDRERQEAAAKAAYESRAEQAKEDAAAAEEERKKERAQLERELRRAAADRDAALAEAEQWRAIVQPEAPTPPHTCAPQPAPIRLHAAAREAAYAAAALAAVATDGATSNRLFQLNGEPARRSRLADAQRRRDTSSLGRCLERAVRSSASVHLASALDVALHTCTRTHRRSIFQHLPSARGSARTPLRLNLVPFARSVASGATSVGNWRTSGWTLQSARLHPWRLRLRRRRSGDGHCARRPPAAVDRRGDYGQADQPERHGHRPATLRRAHGGRGGTVPFPTRRRWHRRGLSTSHGRKEEEEEERSACQRILG